MYKGDDPLSTRWGKASSPWRDVPAHDWEDLRWQLKHLVRTVEQLSGLLNLSDTESASIRRQNRQFRFAISPYYFSLIDTEDPADPIRRMIVPGSEEETGEGMDDPLAERDDQVAPGLVHRYPDRVLFVVTAFCSSYCRFCIRKRNWLVSDAASTRSEIDEAINYLRKHEEVRDVLISGGDPLTLPIDQLDYILTQIRSVPHIEFVRIGSREPVMLPMRITDDLLRLLDKHSPLWINTHFNHPREITEEAAACCEKLARLGIPLGNQTVLLAGVNDDAETMKELFHGLLGIRVRPYYLYQCDAVIGAAHLRTSVWKGVEIMESLRGHTTGLAVPVYVVDAPGGGGKIPLAPNYLISASPGRVVLRNFEGALFSYTDGPVSSDATDQPASSVSDLLSGESQRLIPQGQPHYERRETVAVERNFAELAHSLTDDKE
ncbi:MAG TPA: KamA family radical SAM protein [Pyrinomonadaceae bacterium]|nr:KamA family radical SAM protein [Pyrinomonadaceae bacterium]